MGELFQICCDACDRLLLLGFGCWRPWGWWWCGGGDVATSLASLAIAGVPYDRGWCAMACHWRAMAC